MYRGEFLASLINAHRLETGAELGLWKGRTFFHLLDHCPQLTLIGVDQWRHCPELEHVPGGMTYAGHDMQRMERYVRDRVEKYGERARIIKADTVEAAKEIAPASLDFVWIDATHTEVGVRHDIAAWRG